jgi:hypothetical protein
LNGFGGSGTTSTFGVVISGFFAWMGAGGGGGGHKSFPSCKTIDPRTTSSSKFNEKLSFPSPGISLFVLI